MLSLALFITNCNSTSTEGEKMGISNKPFDETVDSLIEKFGEDKKEYIKNGVAQAGARWTEEDGTEEEFMQFCLNNFASSEEERDLLLKRMEENFETLYGNLHRIERQFKWALQIENGPIQKVDYLFGNYDPYAHVDDDLFGSKIAFSALLNFPITSLKEKYEEGTNWTRKEWAQTRLVDRFGIRVPAKVTQALSETHTASEDYVAHYNVYMYNLLNEKGERLYTNKDLKLVSHWGLRDELKAQYVVDGGIKKQKLIFEVMKNIYRQEIPQTAVDNNEYDWNPYTNEMFAADTKTKADNTPEPNTRFQHILNNFRAELLVDNYSPNAPTKIDRLFNQTREITEKDFEAELISVLSAPVLKGIAELVKERIGRELQPFDIWYSGFTGGTTLSEEELDAIVSAKYPNTEAFQKDLPNILTKLGFTPEKAKFLTDHVQVDPSRGVGHAMGARMKNDAAHLRTRIPETGMLYKGYNIAVHEFGHNVEQVFSLNGVDHYSLEGVPNTAFTEAFAFVFQSRNLELLGIKSFNEEAEAYAAIQNLWSTFEISGVALLDMYMWRWMYENKEATAAQLKEAVLRIAKEIWNKYYEPVLGHKDTDILAIYSHMVMRAMYIPDYPMGHIISFQVEQYLKDKNLATEMERMCNLGRLAPQEWMKQAVGEKVSAQPLISAAEKVIKKIEK